MVQITLLPRLVLTLWSMGEWDRGGDKGAREGVRMVVSSRWGGLLQMSVATVFGWSRGVICSEWTCLCAECWAACLTRGSSKAQERPWPSSLLRCCRCWCSCWAGWAGWAGSPPGPCPDPWACSAPIPPAARYCNVPHLPCCSR